MLNVYLYTAISKTCTSGLNSNIFTNTSKTMTKYNELISMRFILFRQNSDFAGYGSWIFRWQLAIAKSRINGVFPSTWTLIYTRPLIFFAMVDPHHFLNAASIKHSNVHLHKKTMILRIVIFSQPKTSFNLIGSSEIIIKSQC